jgi:hypothetical protein
MVVLEFPFSTVADFLYRSLRREFQSSDAFNTLDLYENMYNLSYSLRLKTLVTLGLVKFKPSQICLNL